MKLGVNQWMFPADLPPAACFRIAKAAGADGVELNISFDKGPLHLQQSPQVIADLAAEVKALNMEVTSLLPSGVWENIAKVEPGSAAANEVCRRLEKLCTMALTLGTDTILIVPGHLGDGTPRYDIAWRNTLSTLQQMAHVATEHGIYLAIENVWSKFLVTPLEMRDFIDACASPFVQAYFDVGNVLLYGFPEHWIEMLAHRIRRVHVKDFRRSVGNSSGFVGLLEGDVNWPVITQALRDIGYDGYITAELSRPAHFWQAYLHGTCSIMQAMWK